MGRQPVSPLFPAAPPLSGKLALVPGRVIGLVGSPGLGLTRLGLSLLAEQSRGAPVVVLDVRGWLSPLAAWEVGIPPERLVVVRCADRRRWPQVAAALLEGIRAVYAEVPDGVSEGMLRRLAALARSRNAAVVLRSWQGDLPAGVTYLRLHGAGVEWEGPEAGHGRLRRRRLAMQVSGKGASGVERLIEVEDDGADTLRVVSGLAVAPPGRAAG